MCERIGVLQWSVSYVQVNLGHRGREGQESEIKKVIVLTV